MGTPATARTQTPSATCKKSYENRSIGKRIFVIAYSTIWVSGPGSSVGIATGYGLDGPAIESRWGRDFLHLSRPALGPTQPSVQWVPGLSRGKERPGRDADPSLPSSAVGHERAELYLYSPYGPYGLYRASVPVQGWPLPFYDMSKAFIPVLPCAFSCICVTAVKLLLLGYSLYQSKYVRNSEQRNPAVYDKTPDPESESPYC